MSKEKIPFQLSPAREELLDVIWQEKREKDLGKAPPLTLFIALPSPEISIEDVFAGTYLAMRENPDIAYQWSRHWGRTTVAINPHEEFSFRFLDRFSGPAKSYIPVETTMLISPREGGKEVGGKYFIVLNNQPTVIEGVVLQAERMMDELVWCLGLEKRAKIENSIEAYKSALEEVGQLGFDYYFLTEEEILRLRNENSRYSVRLYGDKNDRGKVPYVIGAVGPFEMDTKRPVIKKKIISPIATTFVQKEERFQIGKEVKGAEGKSFLSMGISLAKKPHLGHLLLAGVVETARRTMGKETPIFIDGNDTGPRMATTVAYASAVKKMVPKEAIEAINSGQIKSEELEDFYKSRPKATKAQIIEAEEALRLRGLSLEVQGREHLEIFRRFFGNQVSLDLLLESKAIGFAPACLKLGHPHWQGYGFSYALAGGRLLLLEKNGFPSASLMRAAFILHARKNSARSDVVYVDADSSVTDSLIIYKLLGCGGVQFPGAAIGFEFNMATGTGGTSIEMSEFFDKYKTTFPERSLAEDIIFLVNTRYQMRDSKGGLPFFDYQDPNSFFQDVVRAHDERLNFIKGLESLEEKIESLVDFGTERPVFTGGEESEERLLFLIKRLRGLKRVVSAENNSLIFLQPEKIQEYPETQSLIDLRSLNSEKEKSQVTKEVLLQIAIGRAGVSSRVVDELTLHGYSGKGLKKAIEQYIEGNFTMERQRNILFSSINNIKTVVNRATCLDQNSSEILLSSIQTCKERLFNESL